MKFKISVFIVVVFITGLIANPYPSLYQGARQQGIGGAFVGVAEGFDALYYNSAGIASLEKNSFQIINATGLSGLRSSSSSFPSYNDPSIQSLIDLSRVIRGKDEIAILNELNRQVNRNTSVNVWVNLLTVAFLWENFNIAVSPYLRSQNFFRIDDQTDPELMADLLLDGGVFSSVNVNLPYGVAVGLSNRSFVRLEVEDTYNITELDDTNFVDDFEEDFLEGKSEVEFAFDISLLWTVFFTPKILEWKIGANLQNIYSTTNDTQILTLGTSWKWLFLNRDLAILIAGDFVDVLYNINQDSDFGKRFHFGAEVSYRLSDIFTFSFRGGVSQGYPTYGAGIDFFEVLTFNYAIFTEELGAFAGQTGNTRQIADVKIKF